MFKRFWWVFLVMLPVGAIGGMGVMAVVSYVMAELDKAVREQEDKVEERRKVLVIATRTGSFLAGPEMTE